MEFRYAPSADDEIVIWLPDLQVLLSAEVRLEQGMPAVLQAFFACFDTPSAELPKLTLR
jgi:hypothetical protein